MKYMQNIVLAILSVCILGIIVLAGLAELSSREYLFLSILLAGLAIAVTWLVTSITSKSTSEQMKGTLRNEYERNLRTYALKAAEKVQNLSAEMDRLINYIRESSLTGEGEDLKIAAERFRTVGLSIETLKSVNDTALSDWRGIIGDELKKQEQIQTDIDTIFSKLEEMDEFMTKPTVAAEPLWVSSASGAGVDTNWNWVNTTGYAVDTKFEDINRDIVELASQSPIPVRIPKRRKVDAIVKCPKCESENKTRVNLRKDYHKVTRCRNCGNFFSVKVDSDMKIGTDNVETKEAKVKCVLCDVEDTIIYPIWKGYVFNHSCPNCHSVSLASVGGDAEFHLRQSEKISKKFLEILEQIVEGKSPSTGEISEMAIELGISKIKVSQGLTVLLSLGRIEAPEEEGDEGQEEEEKDLPF